MQGLLRTPLPIGLLGSSPTFAKLSAFLRHPLNSSMRKAHRARRTEALELGKFITRDPRPREIFPARIRERIPAAAASISVNPSSTEPNSLSISAIVPNYNHARFLEERIRSIVTQRHGIAELIILDDASNDDSRKIITDIAATLSLPVTTVFNDENSGSIFGQWIKGLSIARGELIWICESDDSCDPDFLRTLAPHFHNPSVMLAFGRIEKIDADGEPLEERKHADQSFFWSQPRVESAYAWFNGPFGTRNVIPNAGGCLFRRQAFSSAFLTELASYKICGDWFFYSGVARGGQIAYEPRARAYFRHHGQNSSVLARTSKAFYEEHAQIARALRRQYGVETSTLMLLLQKARTTYATSRASEATRALTSRKRLREILAEKRTTRHVLMTLPSLHGAEAISSLNEQTRELLGQGEDATILVHASASDAIELRPLIASHVPILSKEIVEILGAEQFLANFGIDHVVSHAPRLDDRLLNACRRANIGFSLGSLT
jgi:glycosyltransferase involved in cell wall biosynthesis